MNVPEPLKFQHAVLVRMLFGLGLAGTNTYLLGTGPERILIDTGEGVPTWRERLATVLAEEHATVTTALLTHWHPDHVSGVQDLRSICPDVRVCKHPRSSSPSAPGIESSSTPAAADNRAKQPSTTIISSGESDSIHDGQVFTVDGSVTLTALHSPGHTTDHMAFQLAEEDGALFTGDNVLGHGTAVFEDLATYMASLARMRDHCDPSPGVARAYPGHGAVIPNARDAIEEYIRHRGQREEEVLHVLAGGDGLSRSEGVNVRDGLTSMQIVQVVYAAYPVSLHQPAERGVIQVLEKLRGEGKVEKCGQGRWRLTMAEKPVL